MTNIKELHIKYDFNDLGSNFGSNNLNMKLLGEGLACMKSVERLRLHLSGNRLGENPENLQILL